MNSSTFNDPCECEKISETAPVAITFMTKYPESLDHLLHVSYVRFCDYLFVCIRVFPTLSRSSTMWGSARISINGPRMTQTSSRGPTPMRRVGSMATTQRPNRNPCSGRVSTCFPSTTTYLSLPFLLEICYRDCSINIFIKTCKCFERIPLSAKSPLLFTLHTHDFNPLHGENSIVKYVNHHNQFQSISNNYENSYGEEINNLADWRTENKLLLNVSKTKELISDFTKKKKGKDSQPCLH